MTSPVDQECFPVVTAEVARFTKVDGCGRPIPGPCSVIVTDDIESISLSPEVDEGERVTVRNMAGRICVDSRPCQSVPFYTATITMCKLMPVLYQLVSGYELFVDDTGHVVGFDVGQNVDCAAGFAVESWGNIPGVACGPLAGVGQWALLTVPYLSAATLSGDIELQNDAYRPVLTATTKLGNAWGTGPFPVMTDSGGNPVPMTSPIAPDKHYRLFKTGLTPPLPACRCFGLSGPPETAPAVTVARDGADPTGMTVIVTVTPPAGSTVTTWQVCFEEFTGTPPVETCANAAGTPLTATHQYATPGTYQIRVRDADNPSVAATTTYVVVTVPIPA